MLNCLISAEKSETAAGFRQYSAIITSSRGIFCYLYKKIAVS